MVSLSGETHLITEAVSWRWNVQLMLGFTQILARPCEVGARKFLQGEWRALYHDLLDCDSAN